MTDSFWLPLDPAQTPPEWEKELLSTWQDEQVFQQSLIRRSPEKTYRFYDGPPFATGTPHYGHILAGAIKDAIPRYWVMKGYHVPRQWGWDCHGVPVEFQVEKENNIGGKPQIEKMGVAAFNKLCRSIVLRCAEQWRDTVSRMGRAVDFEQDYRTMDPLFMEAVWGVFYELFEKGLIYEGEKVVPYSPKLGSPLSNFEAGLNYKDIDDPAITIAFRAVGEQFSAENPTYFLAWTTTPWTLPSNLALGLGRDLSYVLVEVKNAEALPKGLHFDPTARYFLAQEALERYFGSDFQEHISILERCSAQDLAESRYEPLWNFFPRKKETCFRLLVDQGDYVSASDGTGIVHFAPSFGLEDAELCEAYGITGVNPIDDRGYFSAEIPALEGKYFRPDPEVEGSQDQNANQWVLEQLRAQGQLIKKDTIRHSYPHCWRTECALQYRSVKTWFVAVSKIKEQMLQENAEINWIPEHLKTGRFGKILDSAPDWAISRNRYWGTPLPIWRCDRCGEVTCLKNRLDLIARTDQEVTDLHRESVDSLSWDCATCEGTMKRTSEVLDCWFESGSMPYASTGSRLGEVYQNRYYLARHAESENNVLQVYNSALSEKERYGLTEKGKAQAKTEAQKMRDSGVKIDRIISSPFRRAQETAEIMAAVFGCPIETETELRELDLGNIDGHKEFDFTTKYTAQDPIGETGETFAQGVLRAVKVWQKLEQQFSAENILLLTHGGIVGGLSRLTRGEPLTWDPLDGVPKNAKIVPLIPPQESTFPVADFIAEGLDQTRGWFYTLHVLAAGLEGKKIFKNVVTNGIVLAEDGQKMSKSKQNYPDPNAIFEQYGADAMRLYLLGSPVVRGENFRFASKGVEETLKSIILPLRSTYQFLSTYAAVDGWTPTRLMFMRHGQGEHNVQAVYSSGLDAPHELTEQGRAEVQSSAERLPKIDQVFSSPLRRTQQTAQIAAQVNGFAAEILLDKRLREREFNHLNGHPATPETLAEESSKKSDCEPYHQVFERVTDFIREVSDSHRGQTCLVVSHGSPCSEAIAYGSRGKGSELSCPKTASWQVIFPFPAEPHQEELDRWLLGATEELLQNFRGKMDAYHLDEAIKLLPPFIDQLNNWYLRRSRRRFWGSGLTENKRAGYETLHYTLRTLALILAPFAPFFADFLWRRLGGETSVHWEYLPVADTSKKDEALQKKVALLRQISALAASLRSQESIKQRQPLSKLQFSAENTELLTPADLESLKEEANVHQIEMLSAEQLSKLATKTVVVDAKKVGPRLGKKVQDLILRGKKGEFTPQADGSIVIDEIPLTPDEFRVRWITAEGVAAQAEDETVVLLETALTTELKTEGMVRELIRAIQEARKAADLVVSDRIIVTFQTTSEVWQEGLQNFRGKLEEECLISSWEDGIGEKKLEIEGEALSFSVRKARR